MSHDKHDIHLRDWQERQALAERMLPLIGQLYRDQGLVLRIYGRPLINCSTIEILKAHRFVKNVEGNELSIHDSYPILQALSRLELAPARLDLGELTVNFLKNTLGYASLDEYLASQLAPILGGGPDLKEPRDVVLFGFGRIGRLLARLLIERTGSGNKLRLRAIVVRGGRDGDLKKRASLLRRDSVHGPFNGSITVDEEAGAIIANGNFIQIIHGDAPDAVDYSRYGIRDALVVDNTGKWSDRQGLSRHLAAKGAAKVLLTAPAKGDIKNIVYGINHSALRDDDLIVSAASCTTNAITPVLKIINDEFGIDHGHVETVHAYTNDQNLIDNYHQADRRGRSAALNMVITSTGAAKAVAKALPELQGKLTGNAIRVPTPNVSMAVLNLRLGRGTDKEEINAYLRDVTRHSQLREQIDYMASSELVSSDLVGSRHAGIVDSEATIVDGRHCVLYVWYDNEFGYSCQVVRVMREMAGFRLPHLPPRTARSQCAALG